MKKLLWLLLLLLGAHSCFGAVAHAKLQGGACQSASTSGTGFASACSAVSTTTFTYTALSTTNGVLFFVGCACASTTNTFTLTAPSWTITQVGSATGASGSRAALFKAYPFNTSATTFTLSTSVANGNFYNALIEEDSGVDLTNFVDAASNLSSGTGCTTGASVTPGTNDNLIWFACNDSVTATGSPYTIAADDLLQDVAEYKILSGGSGVAQTPVYTSGGAATWAAVAVKPAVSAANPCTRPLMGVGC